MYKLKKLTVLWVVLLILTSFLGVSGCASLDSLKKKDYTITFEDYDGSVLKVWDSSLGDPLIPPDVSMRKGYEFDGWDKDYNKLTKTSVVTANYKAIKNQIYFDYVKSNGNLEVSMSLCGDVEVCGFEGYLSYDTNDLKLESINKVGNSNVTDINFAEQLDGKILVFFFHDQIENITDSLDILIITFSGLTDTTELKFNLNVTVFVNKDFEPVNFNVANNVYNK